MIYKRKLILSEDPKAEAEVEVEDNEPYKGHLSAGGESREEPERFANVMALIKKTAESFYTGYQSIEEKKKPDECEFLFGLKLSTNAGVIFAKAGCEGNFQVTLRWKDKETNKPH